MFKRRFNIDHHASHRQRDFAGRDDPPGDVIDEDEFIAGGIAVGQFRDARV